MVYTFVYIYLYTYVCILCIFIFLNRFHILDNWFNITDDTSHVVGPNNV